MGMHPGMNYPYTAYPMGGGNEDEENAEEKNWLIKLIKNLKHFF